MAFENVLIEQEGNIAIVYVNRPKALNALNAATLKELQQAFAEIESYPKTASSGGQGYCQRTDLYR